MRKFTLILGLCSTAYFFTTCKRAEISPEYYSIDRVELKASDHMKNPTMGTAEFAIDADRNGVDNIKIGTFYYPGRYITNNSSWTTAILSDGYEIFVETAPSIKVLYSGTSNSMTTSSDISVPKKFTEGATIDIEGKTAAGTHTFASWSNSNGNENSYCNFWLNENKYISFINREKKILGYMKVHVLGYSHIVLEKVVVQKYSGNVVIK